MNDDTMFGKLNAIRNTLFIYRRQKPYPKSINPNFYSYNTEDIWHLCKTAHTSNNICIVA